MTATTATAKVAPRRRVPTRAVRKVALGLGFPIFVLIVWQLLSSNRIIDPVLFPTPSSIVGNAPGKITSR